MNSCVEAMFDDAFPCANADSGNARNKRVCTARETALIMNVTDARFSG
jgi:hypothetical protein